mgnify:CR=1
MKVGTYGIDATAIWRQQLARARQSLPAAQGGAAKPKVGEAAGPELVPGGVAGLEKAKEVGAASFGDLLTQAIGADAAAREAVDTYVRGDKPIHETMVAVTKADISLRLMVNVRNKLLEAYREVMRMS